MRLLFLDESGRIGQDGLFALGGVAVRAEDWRALQERWLAPLRAHGWDPANEIKWHGIRTGYVPPALADAVVDALSRAPVTAYVVLLDLVVYLDAQDSDAWVWVSESPQIGPSGAPAGGSVGSCSQGSLLPFGEQNKWVCRVSTALLRPGRTYYWWLDFRRTEGGGGFGAGC